MRKVIASINMSLDGFCDHDAMNADDELHEHFNELLKSAGTMLFGRITYRLMEEAWPAIAKKPTGNGPIDEFAVLIDRMPKIVFSSTLKRLEWNTASLATEGPEETVLRLRQESGGSIVPGSRSIIIALLKRGLIDELQLCVHPSVIGRGLPLFSNIDERIELRLMKTRALSSGILILDYEPKRAPARS